MRVLSTILILLLFLITGCVQATPPPSQQEPSQSAPPSPSQPIQPSTPVSTPVSTPATPPTAEPVPPPPVEKLTSYESERYTNDEYGFSIRYPKTWSPRKPPIETNVFMASFTPQQSDYRVVIVDIRPATSFKNATRDLLYDIVVWRAATYLPPAEAFYLVSENTTQLEDGKGTIYDTCWAIVSYRFYFRGILKDGKAIIAASGWDDNYSDLYKEIIHTITFK